MQNSRIKLSQHFFNIFFINFMKLRKNKLNFKTPITSPLHNIIIKNCCNQSIAYGHVLHVLTHIVGKMFL